MRMSTIPLADLSLLSLQFPSRANQALQSIPAISNSIAMERLGQPGKQLDMPIPSSFVSEPNAAVLHLHRPRRSHRQQTLRTARHAKTAASAPSKCNAWIDRGNHNVVDQHIAHTQ